LTLVIPVYQGGSFLADSLRQAWAWLANQPRATELLVVDDGSSDASAQIVADFAGRHASTPGRVFTALRNAENRGKGFSIRRAFLHAGGDLVVFTDADLTYPLDNVGVLLNALESGADVAYGSRMHAGSRYVVAPSFFGKLFSRHLLGRTFNLLVRMLVVRGVHDTQAGLKGFRRTAADYRPHPPYRDSLRRQLSARRAVSACASPTARLLVHRKERRRPVGARLAGDGARHDQGALADPAWVYDQHPSRFVAGAARRRCATGRAAGADGNQVRRCAFRRARAADVMSPVADDPDRRVDEGTQRRRRTGVREYRCVTGFGRTREPGQGVLSGIGLHFSLTLGRAAMGSIPVHRCAGAGSRAWDRHWRVHVAASRSSSGRSRVRHNRGGCASRRFDALQRASPRAPLAWCPRRVPRRGGGGHPLDGCRRWPPWAAGCAEAPGARALARGAAHVIS
jgi:hypothetical protein